VVQGVLGADASLRVQLYQSLKQLYSFFGDEGQQFFQVLLFPTGETAFEVREFFNAWPGFRGWGS
jgi:hypothetical protein